MEILAPAGAMEQLMAAVRCGADAIYLGAKGFNARASADNFESLSEAVSYCHARGVRVYVTLNTLLMDDEIPQMLDVLRDVQRSGADAVIVQDLAVAQLVRTHCPGLPMHASTQMTIHNAAGISALAALGFSRAVLAREVSLAELSIISAQTDMELEVFIHGALCMSVSGACTLSSMLGGRSGNRGRCAQPCRLDFRSGDRSHALSLKDLCAIDHIEALQKAGVVSLKIEGRMKRPEYVAAAVTAVREAMEGRPYDRDTLQAVFSRNGFTDGYLTGKRNLSMFGMRTEEDAQAAHAAHGALRGLYRRERPAVPVDMTLTLCSDHSKLAITDGKRTVCMTGSAPEVARDTPLTVDNARKNFAKCGDTPFYLRDFHVVSDGAWTLASAHRNGLRRDALDELLALRMVPASRPFAEAPLPNHTLHVPASPPQLFVRLETSAQCPPNLSCDRIILPLHAITEDMLTRFDKKLCAELPPLFFPTEEVTVRSQLAKLAALGLRSAMCENIGAVAMAREAGLEILGGASLNIMNSLSLDAYERLGVSMATVSFELHSQRIAALHAGIPRGAIVYGHLPLMRLRCCPAQQANGCGHCDGHPSLTDRKGISFPLLCAQKRFVSLLNSVPLNLSDAALGGVDFQILYCTLETQDEVARVIDAFAQKKAPEGLRTRGLYFRRVL